MAEHTERRLTVLFRKALSLLLLILLLPIVSSAETVVTSFYPVWLIALNLTDGIPGLTVRNLAAPETGCLHDYQLQAGDMKVLADADLFLVNGAGMESYLEQVASVFPDLVIAEASEGIPLLYSSGALEIGEAEEGGGEANAHIWLSASNAVKMAENMTRALSARFPAYQGMLEDNLEKYTLRLTALDDELKEGLSSLPNKGIITFHEAFPYFAQAYGLEVLAVVNREPGETLTPAQMAALAAAVVELGKPPLFVEPQYEDLSARTLSAETGARVFTLDPVVTGPEENVPLDYYETVMRENMRTLQEALGG